jgi:hypothetical protein
MVSVAIFRKGGLKTTSLLSIKENLFALFVWTQFPSLKNVIQSGIITQNMLKYTKIYRGR